MLNIYSKLSFRFKLSFSMGINGLILIDSCIWLIPHAQPLPCATKQEYLLHKSIHEISLYNNKTLITTIPPLLDFFHLLFFLTFNKCAPSDAILPMTHHLCPAPTSWV